VTALKPMGPEFGLFTNIQTRVLDFCRRKGIPLNLVRATGKQLEMKNRFDAVFTINALEHMRDPLFTLDNMAQLASIHWHQHRRQPGGRNVFIDIANDIVLGLEAARQFNQVPQQTYPFVFARVYHRARVRNRRTFRPARCRMITALVGRAHQRNCLNRGAQRTMTSSLRNAGSVKR
jgi:hypothetical protein